MRLVPAIVIGVLAGALLAWWLTPEATRWNPFSDRSRAPAGAAEMPKPAAPGQAPELFRWRDADGVLHVTQRPPPGGEAFERVDIPQDRNIVPFGAPVEGD